MTNKERIWNKLMEKIGNPKGVAGLMANIRSESAFKSTNLQNSYEKKLGMNDSEYTAAVDSGSYVNFIGDSAGYGLCQWTSPGRKQALLNYARSVGKSIGDMDMQLDFLIIELKTSYKYVWNALVSATSVREASDIVMTKFERPKNQSEKAKAGRAKYGTEYYNQFCKTTAPSTSEQFYPVPNYNGYSIADALKSIGVDNSYTFRKKIAAKNGMVSYRGTISENNRLLDKLRRGVLVRA